MTNVMEFLKSYFVFLAALGMGGAQFWNLRPSEQSPLAFVGFNLLSIAVVVNAAGVLLARRRVRPSDAIAARPTRSARRNAVAALVLTPPIYLVLVLFYQIPNTFPFVIQAGAEPRASNRWLRKEHAHSLLNLPRIDTVGAPLFSPDPQFFASSSFIYYVMIGNRSTVASPPLTVHLELQTMSGSSLPPAQPYYVAVASPAAHPWWPLGDVLGHVGPNTGPSWFTYDPKPCRAPPANTWCFTDFPIFPGTKRDWRDPEIQLPSIPPRGSEEVYLELAFRERQPVSVPVTITVGQSAEGAFAVYRPPVNVDLHPSHSVR